jgi:flavorubredoxin
VAASMIDWLDINPSMRVFTSPRTQVLLPHYGRSDYAYCDVTENPLHALPSGASLKFVEAPFLHFPGAFVTYDTQARYLFSGDIWAALDLDWSLTVDSFDAHIPKMNLFHLDYMASNLVTRGFVRRIEHLAIDAILPQHGSILGPQHVAAALDYLRNLRRIGLGLVVVKNLTQANGGSVGVESEPGRGSTFTLSLPCDSPAVA